MHWFQIVPVAAVFGVTSVALTVRARRDGYDNPGLDRLASIPGIVLGIGVGAFFTDPVGGLLMLALGGALTAGFLRFFRRFPCPGCGGALVYLRRGAPRRHGPHYRCADCDRRFHTEHKRLVPTATTGDQRHP